jgi:hypothetical protein
LIDIGVKPFLVASSTRALMAQRWFARSAGDARDRMSQEGEITGLEHRSE